MAANVDVMRRELIVYLTPVGALGEACDAYFAATRRTLGATTAHSYPPHVTLTGFFRRTPERAEEVVAEFAANFNDALVAPEMSVNVMGLHASPEWVGLVVESEWAKARVAEFVDGHVVGAGDDAIRPKDWLHLSLAYGVLPDGVPLTSYEVVARRDVDPDLASSWRLGLWERTADGAWIQHH